MSPDDRRASILEAARTVVAAEGFGFTTRQVADAAQIAEGTLFRVFETKDALVQAVIGDVLDPSQTETELAGLAPSSLDQAITELVRVLSNSIARTSAFFEAVRSRCVQPPPGPPEHRGPGHHDERNARLSAATTAVLAPFAEQLAISPDRAADFLRVVVFSTAHPYLSPPSDRFTTDQIAQLILHGCTAQKNPRES